MRSKDLSICGVESYLTLGANLKRTIRRVGNNKELEGNFSKKEDKKKKEGKSDHSSRSLIR